MFRSLIFVPGNNARFVEKAKSLHADIICFDLEDSVPVNEKDSARKIVAGAISRRHEYSAGQVYVRTNPAESGLVPDDLRSAAREGIEGIVVPKVNDANEIMEIVKHVSALEQERGIEVFIMPSIESS